MTWLCFFTALLKGLTSLLIGGPLILWWAARWLDDEMKALSARDIRSPCNYDPTSPQAASHPQTTPRSPYETMRQSSPRPVPYDGYPFPYSDYD